MDYNIIFAQNKLHMLVKVTPRRLYNDFIISILLFTPLLCQLASLEDFRNTRNINILLKGGKVLYR
jgi:hypothetical protein